MNDNELRRLTNVVNYLMPHEQKHWEELNKPKGHVYADLLFLQKYIKRRNEKLRVGFRFT